MIVRRIPLYPSPSFPIVIILYCRDTLVTTKKPTSVHSYQLSSLLYSDSLVFPPNVLFLFQDTTLHCYHVFFASFDLQQFLRLPLSLITITALSSTGQRLCRMSSDLGLSIWVMERRVSFSSHHIQSMCLSHGITDDTLTTWLRSGLLGFSIVKTHFPSAILFVSFLISKAHTNSGE